MTVPLTYAARARLARALAERRRLALELPTAAGADAIPADMSFLAWVERLAAEGLKVDGQSFDLSSRPALREI